MKRNAKRILQISAAALVVLLAVGVAWLLVATKESAEQREEGPRSTLVETITVEKAPMRPEVSFKGTMRAARELALPMQVSGEVVRLHPSLEIGGMVREGELLVAVEKTDYEIAMTDAESRLAEAQARLRLEEGRQSVAQEELEFFEERSDAERVEASEALVLRRPQLEIAKAAVARSEAAVQRARLNLERTELRAPFDAIVRSEDVEIGQVAQPGAPLVFLLGSREGRVEARVPARSLDRLNVPGWNAEQGSVGRVSYRVGERSVERKTRILRMAGELDQAGRMARVICVVEDPFGIGDQENGYEGGESKAPALFGSFVSLRFPLRREVELVELPAWAVRDNGRVFVMTEEGRLEIREPEIFLRTEDTTYVSKGLESGDKVVTSLIANPIESMRLRVAEAEEDAVKASSNE